MRIPHRLVAPIACVAFATAMLAVHTLIAPLVVHRWGFPGTALVIGGLLVGAALLDRR